jgi:hypothetical protein
MQTSLARYRTSSHLRAKQIAVWGACALTLGSMPTARAQSFDSRSSTTAAHQDSQRRARTVRAARTDVTLKGSRDDANSVEAGSLTDGQGDIPFLETRIHDLTAKVEELNALLQRWKEAESPIHFVPRPVRATLLEQHRPLYVPQTYGEALELAVRERAGALRTTFSDTEAQPHLAFVPEPREVERLLQPIDEWLAVRGTRPQMTEAHLQAMVYVTLLAARANIDSPEPLPAVHKLLHELHVDRAALSEHLRRSFLLDNPTLSRDLSSILAVTAATYPEPSSMRDFLMWVSAGVGSDLKEEAQQKANYPFRSDPGGQFDAAAENATSDNGDVLKLQVELQRMLVEAKALSAMNRVESETAGAWELRLLYAERALDQLLRSADSEREAVMTLARRVPVEHKPRRVAKPAVPLQPEVTERLAADNLTEQH